MSLAPVASLVVLLTLSAVLLVSGVAKLRDARATRDAFDALRVPAFVPADPAASALPWLEISLGVLLLVTPSGWLVPVALGVALLMLVYTVLVARALGFEEPVSCSCFGSLGRHDVDRTTLGRNVLLTVLAAVAVWWARDGGSAPAAVSDLDAGGWWALAATLAAATVAVLVARGASPDSAPRAADSGTLEYERRLIPYGVLTLADGSSATLAELARTQACLLVILSPRCGPCDRVAARLDDWAAQLDPTVRVLASYPSEPAANESLAHSRELVALEPELNVRRLLASGTPSAVLLGADGLLAGGPVGGEDTIFAFVEDVLVALALDGNR